MPKPISSSSQSQVNACYPPDPTASDSVCLTPSSAPATPPAASSSPSSPSSPAVQQLVERSRTFSSIPNGVNAGSTGVLLCRRIADVPLKEYTGFQHHYLMTNATAAGAGHCGDGVPGHGRVDLPLSPMCINDHSSEIGNPSVICDPIEADPECVNKELEIGKYIGLWAPPFNDCQTFAASVIENCKPPADPNADAATATGAEGARGY